MGCTWRSYFKEVTILSLIKNMVKRDDITLDDDKFMKEPKEDISD